MHTCKRENEWRQSNPLAYGFSENKTKIDTAYPRESESEQRTDFSQTRHEFYPVENKTFPHRVLPCLEVFASGKADEGSKDCSCDDDKQKDLIYGMHAFFDFYKA